MTRDVTITVETGGEIQHFQVAPPQTSLAGVLKRTILELNGEKGFRIVNGPGYLLFKIAYSRPHYGEFQEALC